MYQLQVFHSLSFLMEIFMKVFVKLLVKYSLFLRTVILKLKTKTKAAIQKQKHKQTTKKLHHKPQSILP